MSNKKGLDQETRLRMLFDETIQEENIMRENIDDINYYNLLCKSIAANKFYKFFNSNLSLFRYVYEGNDSVLMIFSIPIQSNKDEKDKKHITERIMEIVKSLEKTFVTIDYMTLQEVKEDKYYYLNVIIKKK